MFNFYVQASKHTLRSLLSCFSPILNTLPGFSSFASLINQKQKTKNPTVLFPNTNDDAPNIISPHCEHYSIHDAIYVSRSEFTLFPVFF